MRESVMRSIKHFLGVLQFSFALHRYSLRPGPAKQPALHSHALHAWSHIRQFAPHGSCHCHFQLSPWWKDALFDLITECVKVRANERQKSKHTYHPKSDSLSYQQSCPTSTSAATRERSANNPLGNLVLSKPRTVQSAWLASLHVGQVRDAFRAALERAWKQILTRSQDGFAEQRPRGIGACPTGMSLQNH